MKKIFYSIKKVEKTMEVHLPRDVLLHIENHKNLKLNTESLVAWQNLEILLNNIYNTSLFDQKISFSKRGKPLLGNYFISLSHSHGVVAVCVSKENCAIDIERMDDKKDIDEISKNLWGEVYGDKQEFYKKWTQLETVAKLRDISIFDAKNKEDNKIFYENIVKGDYFLSICAENEFELIDKS